MGGGEVCIATMTLARTASEVATLGRSLQSLAALNVPVIVTDGGSTEDFVDFLRGFAHFRVFENAAAGVVEQTRHSLRAAAKLETKFILYTEPDKKEFFELHARDFITQINQGESPAVVIAARSAEGFATFPAFQQYTESVMNHLCARYVQLPVDFCYGPLILDRALVPALDQVSAEIGWGWRFFVFAMARRLGWRLETYTNNFVCPFEQRQEDDHEHLHRLRQLSQNIRGLMLGLECPLPHEK